MDPLFLSIFVTSFRILIENNTSGIHTVIARTTIWTIHIICQFAIDLTINDLSIASSRTEDADSVPGVNRDDIFTSVHAGWTTEHDCSLSDLVGYEIVDHSAIIANVHRNGAVT